MAKRKRFNAENPCPVRMEYKKNGAAKDEQRLTTVETATRLQVPKRTLLRWWTRMRFPAHAEFEEAYEPDEEYRGDQMRLLWPVSVVDRIEGLLEKTQDVAGLPGIARLPPVPWSYKKK